MPLLARLSASGAKLSCLKSGRTGICDPMQEESPFWVSTLASSQWHNRVLARWNRSLSLSIRDRNGDTQSPFSSFSKEKQLLVYFGCVGRGWNMTTQQQLAATAAAAAYRWSVTRAVIRYVIKAARSHNSQKEASKQAALWKRGPQKGFNKCKTCCCLFC